MNLSLDSSTYSETKTQIQATVKFRKELRIDSIKPFVSQFSRNSITSSFLDLIESRITGKTAKGFSYKRKTEMCTRVEVSGYCSFGDKCNFAHDKSELQPMIKSYLYKTKKCASFYGEGWCKYGSRCQYIHFDYEAEISKQQEKLLLKGLPCLIFVKSSA